MSKLTKKPKRPVLSRLTKTLVAGTVLVSGCGDEIGLPAVDAGPADVMEVLDVIGVQDAPTDVPTAPDSGSADAGNDVAPVPGVPAFDAG